MRSLINGKQKHFLIWALLLVYILSSNQLYTDLFVRNGKPVSQVVSLPASAKEGDVIYKLANFVPVRYEGQDLFELRGYIFPQANPKLATKITVILISQNQRMAFSTDTVPTNSMIKSFAGYSQGMEKTQFRMLLSKHALNVGVYQIGILLEDMSGSRRWFVPTGATIQKTPNSVRYVPAS